MLSYTCPVQPQALPTSPSLNISSSHSSKLMELPNFPYRTCTHTTSTVNSSLASRLGTSLMNHLFKLIHFSLDLRALLLEPLLLLLNLLKACTSRGLMYYVLQIVICSREQMLNSNGANAQQKTQQS